MTPDFETKSSYVVTINVNDTTLGAGIDLSGVLTINVTDIFEGGGGNTYTGNPGNNTATAPSAAPWTAFGLGGNDTLTGGAGFDTIDGGAGNDELRGGAGNDSLIGGNENDRLFGEADNDTLRGDAGNDSLDGGLGADSMEGGTGGDSYYIDNIGDVIIEAAGGGSDYIYTSINYTMAPETESMVMYGGVVSGTGNASNNTIIANSGANILFGLDGNDSLDGRGGADQMTGGNGNDLYYVDNAGDVTIELDLQGIDIVLSSVSHTLMAFVENLTLTGTGNLGTGNGLANVINGGAQNDVLTGLVGNDTLLGNNGADRLIGGAGADSLGGGAGNDMFVFGAATALEKDYVGDFIVGADKLEFRAADYAGLSAATLKVQNAATATLGSAQFLFNTATKELSWDADGVAGGHIVVANLNAVVSLALTDFSIV